MRILRLASLRRWCVAGLVAIGLALPLPAGAAPQNSTASDQPSVLTLEEAAALLRVDPADLQRLAEGRGVPGRRIGTAWRFERAALLEWLGASGDDARLSPAYMRHIVGQGMPLQQDAADGPAPPSSTPAEPTAAIGNAPDQRRAEDVFLRGNRLLLGRGDVVLDVGQFYARQDSLLLTPVGAGVGLVTAEQSALTTVVFGRVGIFRETEVFAGTSFSRQTARQLTSGTILTRTRTSGLGTATAGLRRTVLREGPRRPDVVVSVSGQIPTEDRGPAAGGGVVLVKSLDPVVLFANVNYAHPFKRAGVTRQPVSTIDFVLGYGLGLNDTTAISMAVGGLFLGKATTDAGAFTLPPAFSARFSVTTAVGSGFYLEPSVGFGLSGPGQSFTFGITMPYSF